MVSWRQVVGLLLNQNLRFHDFTPNNPNWQFRVLEVDAGKFMQTENLRSFANRYLHYLLAFVANVDVSIIHTPFIKVIELANT